MHSYMLRVSTPTQLHLIGYDKRKSELLKQLSYVDNKIDYQLRKFKSGASWFIRRNGQEAYELRVNELLAERTKSLLFEDDSGLWTYSGLATQLAESMDDRIQAGPARPSPKAIPWATAPAYPNRYYQDKAEEKLLEAGHAGVEIGTGLGKSTIIRNLLKAIGLQAVIMAPSVNIALQLYDDLVLHFGKAKVGQFFDGKKQFDKLFTVAVAQSLTKVAVDSPIWKKLSQAAVFIADESHQCPAATLARVCFGLVKNAPYRFFFSGTQVRNDGLGMLLDAITGPIVYRMTVQEGVDQGFLARPVFRMVRMKSTVTDDRGQLFDSNDVNELTRAHVYYNPQVVAAAAQMANKAVSLMGRQTLILVDELEQWEHLAPLLRYEAKFANGGPKSDPKELVARFNAGEFPILVGTSCVATGTDFKTVQCIIYLRGGKSEIEIKQGVGRGTRLVPGKADCIVIDFAIDNVEQLARHAKARKALYSEIYPSYSEVTI